MAETVAAAPYVNVPAEVIVDRILGRYRNGLGREWTDPAPIAFHADGAVNFPYPSDGVWFLTQFKRWGLVGRHPEYAAIAAAVNQVELYREAAGAVGVALPASPVRSARLIDGAIWSGADPARHADAQAIRADKLSSLTRSNPA
jgi:nitrate/nitrite transport system substrate-binding protein